jgi:hypothetical protein
MERVAERAIARDGKEVAVKEPGLWQILRQYATPRLTAAAIVWRAEAYTATPLAIFCIERFGRWNGALVMGLIMAGFSALFLFLLHGEEVVDALREWLRGRRFIRRFVLPIKRSEGLAAAAARSLAAPWSVMMMGPFQRAAVYRVLRVRNTIAYPLSVGGAIPHSLFWTGLVFGSVWELAFRPAVVWLTQMLGDLVAPLF